VRDAVWIRQRRPQWLPGETECRHVQVQAIPAVQFIALCEASGASPQAALRGMAAMVCGLRYDDDNRLLPLEVHAA
jgi:hypothetical protein